MLVIAFDADDTLWVNEPYFRESEETFAALFEDYLPMHQTQQELFKTEMDNLALYGYGVKGFMLSMIETAIRITGGNLSAEGTDRILEIGKELLERPIEILPHVDTVLEALSTKYRLVVATKGDLAIAAGIMVPFLIWDAVKAVAAGALLPLAWKAVKTLKG